MVLAERLVGEARARRARRMDSRERMATSVDAGVTVGLLLAYAIALHVRFEFAGYYGTPEQLVFIPMLLLGPLPLVPLLAAAAAVLSMVPDVLRGNWHREQWLSG